MSIVDFSDYVAERTEEFTGREWVFKAINDWLARSDGPRFFLLTGEPGSGKTAIAGQLNQFSRGEIHSPEGLTYLTRNFLSAVHFCSAGDRRWTSPHVFSESLALQLADRYPAYAKALAEKSGDRQIRIEVEQRVQQVVSGEVTGVVIKNLEVKGGSAEDAFVHLVREPLETLFREGYNEQIVILVDALDEALLYSGGVGMVHLLAQAEHLPAEVRFIVTSRPEVKVVRPLQRSRPAPEECSLTTGAGLGHSLDDVKGYVLRALAEWPQLANELAADLSRAAFAAAVQHKSEGNFLYVKYLLQMLVSQQARISRASLDELPDGLDGIYIEFLERLLGDDEEAWLEKYAPVAGTLAVAQQPLTEEQLAGFVEMNRHQLRAVLKRLLQFLNVDDSLPARERAYAIYHRSFADFLLDADRSEEYWCEEQEQHKRIVEPYRRGAASWEEIDWSQVDNYGLRHLAYHLRGAGYRKELYALLTGSQDWMDRKFEAFASDRPYVTDLELAISDFTDPLTSSEPVVTLVKLHTARHVVNARVSRYSDTDLQTLVWLGREDEALAQARLRDRAGRRFSGLLAIYSTLKEKGQANPSLLNEAREVAGAIADDRDRSWALSSLAAVLAQAGDERGANAVFGKAQEAADAIADDRARSWALSSLAAALAQAGRFNYALVLLGLRELDEFLQALAAWAASFEQVESGLSIDVLREAICIAGWVRSDWQKIHEMMLSSEQGTS